MYLSRKTLLSALASMAVVAVLTSCGGGVSSDSDTPSDQSTNASAEEDSQPITQNSDTTSDQYSDGSTEDSSNAADTVGDLILLSSDSLGVGGTYTLTFIDTETGESDSRSFTLPETAKINPKGNWRLPFNEDLTKLAVVSDGADDGWYYRSAGYVEADAGYTEETTSQSSFEGESGYYAATFHDGQLWVMNKSFEWIDPASGDVRATGPRMDDASDGYTDLYINGSNDPTGYGVGECSENDALPSRVTTGCYQVEFDGGDIELYFDDQETETIEISGGACDIYSLLALDSKDNLYCVEEILNGQEADTQRIIRIDRNTGEALAITPETDQAILQAIVSSDDQQVLFKASRDDDLAAAYVVPATGGTEPRELSALSDQLSEEQSLYSWTAN